MSSRVRTNEYRLKAFQPQIEIHSKLFQSRVNCTSATAAASFTYSVSGFSGSRNRPMKSTGIRGLPFSAIVPTVAASFRCSSLPRCAFLWRKCGCATSECMEIDRKHYPLSHMRDSLVSHKGLRKLLFRRVEFTACNLTTNCPWCCLQKSSDLT